MKQEKTMYDYFAEYADDSPDEKFIFDDSRKLTVREAFSTAIRIAADLSAREIKSGDLIVLRCTRSLDACVIYYALQFLGATAVLTDPHVGAARFMEKCGVKFDKFSIVTDERDANTAETASGFRLIKDEKIFDLDVSPVHPLPDFTPHRDARSLSTVVFTSGSTGKNKAVMLSQDNILKISEATLDLGWYLRGDIAIAALPFHHVFGLSLITTALVARYALYFPKSVEITDILSGIEKYRITRMNGVPSLYLAIARANETERRDVSSLRTGLIGGASVTKEQFIYIEKTLGVTMIPAYGMSECIAIACASYKDDADVRAVTNGRFYEMSKGYILDESGRELPQGVEGEICVSSPSVMLGYYGDASATADAIDAMGRLRTGDLGYIDENGRLHVSGRKKDIIIRNGLNISSVKIEAALSAIDGVSAAAVVGIKHDLYGETPCALVVAEGVSEKEIVSALASKLDKNELPEKIVFTARLPMTASGKPDKQKIKEMLGNG